MPSGLRISTAISRCRSRRILFSPQGWVQVSSRRSRATRSIEKPSARFASRASSPSRDGAMSGRPSTSTCQAGLPASFRVTVARILPSGEETLVSGVQAARTRAVASPVATAAERSGDRFMVGFCERFRPAGTRPGAGSARHDGKVSILGVPNQIRGSLDRAPHSDSVRCFRRADLPEKGGSDLNPNRLSARMRLRGTAAPPSGCQKRTLAPSEQRMP